ncbi:nitroreductase family protein [Methanosphaera sp. WGK6]|uniref:nitroreductase family protein n=1 Tax=Methanosphaera sp. WGK6 TaxID=1561964 RepID=UPI00084CCF47|nr:nitroreductase family protein [Methanosphaera sp. WGK6]OED30049.1 nitroreductase [Methanosphaera sp. WGK6]
MSVLETIEKRYSVRGYEDKEVEEEKLQKILKAAQLAPTGVNAQAFKVYVIDTKKNADKLKEVYSAEWLIEAPIVLAVVSKANDAWIRPWDSVNINEIDATIVMDHMILEATELGLGTCYIAAFHERPLIDLLKLSEEEHPVLLTPVGYPNAEPRETGRKSLEELVEYI